MRCITWSEVSQADGGVTLWHSRASPGSAGGSRIQAAVGRASSLFGIWVTWVTPWGESAWADGAPLLLPAGPVLCGQLHAMPLRSA